MAPHTPSWSPDGKNLAATIGVSNAESSSLITLDATTGRRREILPGSNGTLSQPVWLPDGRNLLILQDRQESGYPRRQIALVSFPDGTLTPVTRDANDYTGIAIDASGATIATVQRDLRTSIDVLDESGASLSQIEAEAPVTGVAWTADGRVVYSEDRQLFLVSGGVSGGQSATTLLPNEMVGVREPDVCPNGTSIVFTGGVRGQENRLNVYRLDTKGGRLKRLTSGSADVRPSCLRDGSVVYVDDHGGDEGTLMLATADGGAPRRLVDSVTAYSTDVSLDRRTASYTDLNAPSDTLDRFTVADINTGKTLTQRTIPKDWTATYRLSPDGRGLSYHMRMHGADNIYREPPKGGDSTQVTKYQSGKITDFRYSPDGKKIAVIHASQQSDVALIRDENGKNRP
jgi:Tol biopolymer transport system component